ncbi:MAG: restriction endonuclease [Flavobacteriaceae bacterium]|nr:restriction endonuclease [Flavobacteriaceae bacterium]
MQQRKLEIEVFEHESLRVGDKGIKQHHIDALWRLNEHHENSYFEPIARGVKFKQYVGIIQVNGLSIEIHPKADKYDSDTVWKEVLLDMLKACGRIKSSTNGPATLKKRNLNLLEVYFEYFLNEVSGLIHRGLIKQYRKETKNTKALKGKLEFAGHIQRNSIHKERFYTTHQVYDTDHTIHQILSKALSIVEQFSKGTYIYDYCKRTVLDFPEVKQINVNASHFKSLKKDRKTAPYEYALELARLIILNYSPDISSGKEKMLSLLFDMNQLWEEYVLIQLKKHTRLHHPELMVTGQESKKLWGYNSIRPDIVIKNTKTNKTVVIDTKWKNIGNGPPSIQDLRQMYGYARYWNAERVMLLYPGEDKTTHFKPYLGEYDEVQHYCKLGVINIIKDGKLDLEIGSRVLSLMT